MPGYDHPSRSLAIATRIAGTRAAIAVSGELDIAGVPELEAALLAQEAAGRDIDLDMTDLTYIDSAGMTVLFQTAQRARRAGWELTVVGVGKRVAEMLELTGLDAVLGLDDAAPGV
jgi:anti-sigma B factor antagonist